MAKAGPPDDANAHDAPQSSASQAAHKPAAVDARAPTPRLVPAPSGGPARDLKHLSRRQLRRLAKLAELPGKIPEKLEVGLERGRTVAAEALRDPVGTAAKVIDTLQASRSLALGWAIALLLPILLYLFDLGSGSIWSGADAQLAQILVEVAQKKLTHSQAASQLSSLSISPLSLAPFVASVRLLGPTEATLRLLPSAAALGCALCLLAVAIDSGVGRHVGGLAGLVFLAMPVTYALSHRVLPDLAVALASVGSVALVSHSLHGHKFDRHILPIHREVDEPAPLPLRRLPMLFAALGIGAAALVDPRAALLTIVFALCDVLVAHRYLLRKRRFWLMLAGAIVLTVAAISQHPLGFRSLWHHNGRGTALAQFFALWHQGASTYARHVGQVIVVAAGFGLLLGALRRASRSLLLWIVMAGLVSGLGPPVAAPQGLGLLLPPLALAAAVGLQSPVRWLGRLGGAITLAALAGVVLATAQGAPVLHPSDSIKLLAQLQSSAGPGTKRCAIAVPPDLLRFYGGEGVLSFDSPSAFFATLAKEQPFSCLVSAATIPEFQRVFATLAAARTPAPSPPEPKRDPKKLRRDPRPTSAPTPTGTPGAAITSVLSTTIDIEEPPQEVQGPQVALISR